MALGPSPGLEHLRKRSLPPVRPEGPGHMPLWCAAYWIGVKGAAENFDLIDAPTWEDAFSQLLARISSDEVIVTGIRDGERERIPGYVFVNIGVQYPWSNDSLSDHLYLSHELYLCAGAYLDEEHRQREFDDKLVTGSQVKWGKLLLLKSEVARWWPFGLGAPPADSTTLRTGAPGRPSSMHLILAEHSARWDRGQAEGSIKAEARALRAWFQQTYKGSPAPSTVTIENRIRKEYWMRKREPRN
jgi:hypothetical protein